MRKLGTLMIAGFLSLAPIPAQGSGGGGERDCGGSSAGCDNEREENYGSGSCKYFCPSFEESPVDIQVCVQPNSCTERENNDGGSAGNSQ